MNGGRGGRWRTRQGCLAHYHRAFRKLSRGHQHQPLSRRWLRAANDLAEYIGAAYNPKRNPPMHPEAVTFLKHLRRLRTYLERRISRAFQRTHECIRQSPPQPS